MIILPPGEVLLVQHPDLLAPSDTPVPRQPLALRTECHPLDAVRDLDDVLEFYRIASPMRPMATTRVSVRHDPTDWPLSGGDEEVVHELRVSSDCQRLQNA